MITQLHKLVFLFLNTVTMNIPLENMLEMKKVKQMIWNENTPKIKRITVPSLAGRMARS